MTRRTCSSAAHCKRRPITTSLKGAQPSKPGTLILLRHGGGSTWNAGKLFTGWVDVDLSARGRREMEHAAQLMLERGYKVDAVYTSVLKERWRVRWFLAELRQTPSGSKGLATQ